MKLHEYQAKELLDRYGVPLLPGRASNTAEGAVEGAIALGGDLWVVKAQIHAGGRGKGRFIEEVSAEEIAKAAAGEKAEGILQLVVTPAHAPLIQHVIPEIIERVNQFFGYRAVVRVKLRQGAVQPPASNDAQRPARTAPPSLKPIPMELGDSLRDIGDPELRTVLESLARSLGEANGTD